jgi:predicted metal-binding membrane protein
VWRHPEWWCVAFSATAWVVLLGDTHAVMPGNDLLAEVGNWVLMLLAMMIPLTLGPIRRVSERSLWRRRHRAIAVFLLGYLSSWLLLGMTASVLLKRFTPIDQRDLPIATALALLAAAAWQLTGMKRWALASCHRTMAIAPDGWKAERDAFRYGALIARYCLLSCGPAMLVTLLAGHQIALLALTGAILIAERWAPRLDGRVTAAALLGLSALALAPGHWLV